MQGHLVSLFGEHWLGVHNCRVLLVSSHSCCLQVLVAPVTEVYLAYVEVRLRDGIDFDALQAQEVL